MYSAGLYTDESPGLKVDPVVVMTLSVVFIFSVVALHGTHTRVHCIPSFLTLSSHRQGYAPVLRISHPHYHPFSIHFDRFPILRPTLSCGHLHSPLIADLRLLVSISLANLLWYGQNEFEHQGTGKATLPIISSSGYWTKQDSGKLAWLGADSLASCIICLHKR